MIRRLIRRATLAALFGSFFFPHFALALDPHKALSQYTRTEWTQADGLPQDTVSVIAQTSDGYLWLGTNEGLVRFDGYDFAIFTRDHGDLPANSISSLAAGTDGSLWIGTSRGLARYHHRRFEAFSQKDGLPADSIAALLGDSSGKIWVVCGGRVSQFDGVKFQVVGSNVPQMETIRTLTEGRAGEVYAAGSKSIYKIVRNSEFVRLAPRFPADFLPTALKEDGHGNLWVMGTRGLLKITPSGEMIRFGPAEGLPYSFGLGAMWEDRQGTFWVGSYNGLARVEEGKLETTEQSGNEGPASVRSIFEDREGSLWVGSTNGLARLRDDLFTFYGKREGLPSDQINTVFEDHKGRVWLGFLDGGMASFSGSKTTVLPKAQGYPQSRVFAIRETSQGDLLISAGDGLFRMDANGVHRFLPPVSPQLQRPPQLVYDAIEGSDHQVWLALPTGLAELRGDHISMAVPAKNQLSGEGFVVLAKGPDGTVWGGTSSEGLWQVKDGRPQLVSTGDDLGNAAIRSIYPDPQGIVWIGTFGGGLASLRDGKLTRYTARDGLPSDNIGNVIDDGDSLWLSTTRGICRISRKELLDFDHSRLLQPQVYGISDGLRSVEVAPRPGAGGGRHADGSLWFATPRGIAVYNPRAPRRHDPLLPPAVAEMTAGGKNFDSSANPQIPAGAGSLEIRYAALHLRAPERVQYSYRLEGADSNWVDAGGRRLVTYSGLGHGHYTLHLRAALPGEPPTEAAYSFDVLPRFYETNWFRAVVVVALLGLIWLGYLWRERQIHSRFELVLNERARLAQEVHDTMSQAFVGISSQLDGVFLALPEEAGSARAHLNIARRMARHSLTEAHRSIMDLRTAALDDEDLASALESNARLWTSGSGVELEVSIEGSARQLPDTVAHQVLRIAQEGVTNALKHAQASKIHLWLSIQPSALRLKVSDDGHGFEGEGVFLSATGHFGLIGMRERAQRLRGKLQITSRPGAGTEVELSVPL